MSISLYNPPLVWDSSCRTQRTLADSWTRKAVEYVAMGNDCLSTIRYGVTAAASALSWTAGSFKPVAIGFGIAASVVRILSGLSRFYAAATKICSMNTMTVLMVLQQVGECIAGTSLIVIGVGMIIFDCSVTTGALFLSALVINIAYFIFFGTILGVAIFRAVKCGILRKECDQMLEQLEQGNKTAPLEALRKKLSADTECETVERLERFAFRSSELVCRSMQNALNNPEISDEDLKFLILETKREAWKQVAKHCMAIALSAIGIVGLFLSIYCPVAWPAFLVFSLISGAWLIFDSSHLFQKIGDFFFPRKEEEAAFWACHSVEYTSKI